MKHRLTLLILTLVACVFSLSAADLPEVSTNDKTTWYVITFANSGFAVTAQADGSPCTITTPVNSDAQQWKVEGSESAGYTLTNKAGKQLYIDKATASSGDEGFFRVAAAPASGETTFTLTPAADGESFLISPKSNSGLYMNQFQGAKLNHKVGLWNDKNDAGSPVKFEKVNVLSDNMTIEDESSVTAAWDSNYWTQVAKDDVPLRIGELGHYHPNVFVHETTVKFDAPKGVLSTTFQYSSGTKRLQIVGVDLVQENNVAVSDYHFGFTGGAKSDNVYNVTVPYAGTFKLRFFVSDKGANEGLDSRGSITLTYGVVDTLHLVIPATTPIEGKWSRQTTLKAGDTWNVSAVVGLVAPGQQRRSVLAYSERERAVPWRPYPVYISWYELNINRNNATAPEYKGNMTVQQCVDVVKHWNDNFYAKYKMAPKAFVWDDGWDEYGTWKFNKNFPNGFKEPADEAVKMGTGIGAWLGPVGGYGTSGNYRRAYWASKGGMQLSNKEYYDFFVDACRYMVNTYDFRFFKYDGISAQFSATGPDAGATGEENAEAIIHIERDLRATKPDLFLNTTVGTWASPFWFQFTDAVWRQEMDYGEMGNQGSDREKWITYRDRLVYQNFVQNSPLCPINTLMTHGFILSKFGNVSKDMNYDGIVREMRCAFACGSGMVELYNDYELMNSIADKAGNKGALWGELANCMKWQEEMADVLPDIHWVGGNPWDGGKANIYGWAAWNGQKAAFTLRNPAASKQTITLTLRKALDIPAYVNTTITLTKAFADQVGLEGVEEGKAIDVDTQLTINMPASSVFVFNGKDNNPTLTGIGNATAAGTQTKGKGIVYDLSGRRLSAPVKGVNIIDGQKVIR